MKPKTKNLQALYNQMKGEMTDADRFALGIGPRPQQGMGDVRMKDELKMRQRFAEEEIRKGKAKKRREQLEKYGKRMA